MNATDRAATVDPMPEKGATRQSDELIAVVSELVRELHMQHTDAPIVSATSRLDRDLGIDSIGRTELLLRIEHAFHVRLPSDTLSDAETVADLQMALQRAAPQSQRSREFARPHVVLPIVSAAHQAVTLMDVLEWHESRNPDRTHATLMEDDNTIVGDMTYRQLGQAARQVAMGLIENAIVPGDRVAIMLPTGLDFFAAFFGVLYTGAVPVPIYPPPRLAVIEEHIRRQAGILNNCGARILITMPAILHLSAFLRGQARSLQAIETADSLRRSSKSARLPVLSDPKATAFLQYTSGSTGDPKGVVLSHANLLANIRAIGNAAQATSADVFVSWLPLYHDLGLIGGWLGCLYCGAQFYVMSPLSFLRRPESWLWAIHRFRGTLSAAPNFGFELCANKINDTDIEGLDLSSLRIVVNGAEAVSVPTLRRFTARFSRYGFKPEAMSPAFGLAENTVALTFPPVRRPPLIDQVDRNQLTRHGFARVAKSRDAKMLEIVSCGPPLPEHEVRIVDEQGRVLPERQEGRLEFRGPSATSGYFRNEAKTRELFRHFDWLDTGDLAYLADGEVYVTGRVKDIIIRAGRHIYPHEIEQAVGQVPGIIGDAVAAFGVTDPARGTERIVVIAETRDLDPEKCHAREQEAQMVTTDVLGAPADEIVLLPPQSVPKTASGKIRRGAARELYIKGLLGKPRPTVRRQIWRLLWQGQFYRLSQFAALTTAFIYSVWWWIVVSLAATLAWLAVMILPRLDWRWAAVRGFTRAALAAVGAGLSVNGIEHVRNTNALLVVNHSSYADALVVAATIPGAPAFVAKKELAEQFFAGPFLRRLGTCFVDRYEVVDSISDVGRLHDLARAGRLLVFFPEGTFARRSGLAGFYLGAFKVAAEVGLPVVPAAIRGTRLMLPNGNWLPRRSRLSIDFGIPIAPKGRDFASAIALRDSVRNAILTKCGEPDLGALTKPERPGLKS